MGRFSERSAYLLKAGLSYRDVAMQAYADVWSEENMSGWIPLVIAENRLSNDVFLDRLQEAQRTPLPPSVLCYSSMGGMPEFRACMARVMSRCLMPGVEVAASELCVSCGVSSILDNLFHLLGGAGEGVLIPAPYYPAFDNDLYAKAGLHPLPFFLDEDGDIPAQLDAAVDAYVTGGDSPVLRGGSDGPPSHPRHRVSRVCTLLLTNPNNPLGTIYRDATLRSLLRWCVTRGVHLVSDEVYGLSVHGPGASFTSLRAIAQREVEGGADGADAPLSRDQVDAYLHVLWGLSKDFCGSGLRIGVLHSRNATLHAALEWIAIFGTASNLTQHVVGEALRDDAWVDGFVAGNRVRLAESYVVLTAGMTRIGVPFTPAVGAMFLWIDLSAWLPEPTWAAERAFWERLSETSRVVFTPGHDCHAARPGCFRVCFAWMPKHALAVAVERLGEFLAANPRTG